MQKSHIYILVVSVILIILGVMAFRITARSPEIGGNYSTISKK